MMLNTLKITLCFFTLIATLLSCQSASAEDMNCTSDTNSYVLNLGNVAVAESSKAGDILFVNTNNVNLSCKSTGNFQQASEVSYTGWSSSGMTVAVDGLSCPVIDQGTAISDSGLGIVWTNYNSASGTWTCMSSAFSGSSIRRGLLSNGATTTLTDKIYIVRTNTDLKYGETSELAQTVFVDEANADRVSRGHLYSFSFSGVMSIAAGGCTVGSVPDVEMGTLSTASFSGAGSIGPRVPFSVSLTECRGSATQAHFDFTPIYGFASQQQGVIALSDDDNSATGLGIQLLMNGKAIAGFSDNVATISKGDNLVNFEAKYYQTAETVTPGSAESMVVFNVFYN
ncbi:fimbrial protein [Erwinia billingiae]|uniref:fimbrial protein n=2 Tax=Erwinia billingiae TaxID=182337 RepID=UPI000CFEADD3|nr:fimbrial protein [Erwinia billingiae]PRB59258.1 hypothetical protein CQ001_10510 [Erwinia billingiae]